MAYDDGEGRGSKLRTSVKGPLIFATVLALVAGVVTTVAATGGTGPQTSNGTMRMVRFDLGLIAFGIAFVVVLVVCAVLMMSFKENDEELGAGSGVNLRSADRQRKPVRGTRPSAQDPQDRPETDPGDPASS
ncbi:hypothetical protein [Psychromicrobium xiongbiense]|uniref:hypothetical protein n=1 Tax=Psychromicrobium xiongbiense TaxID=3051184 RepID=UPI0025533AD4|nr:hypothetical protein [Psychromicrobium sp. YIM S02556]